MLVIHVKNNDGVYAVDNCAKLQSQTGLAAGHAEGDRAIRRPQQGGATAGLRACSACAGDYEDPDRTARAPHESGGEEREDEADQLGEEFPAEEQ